MAEPGGGGIPNQRLIPVIVGLVVIVFGVLFFTFRSCAPSGPGSTVIYSDLDLSDAAKVVARLKELKIPYEIKEKGTAIAVPKELASSARLGLAEKNLPSGGVVGWEIFNETKMGATDFDRRIQLIRAISGELSRTIRRIDGVADARVQIVLPETRLFEVTKIPVTASVLIKLNAGSRIKPEHIRGIIHLVASSVENLKPDNVTVVDESGNILSALAAPPLPKLPPAAVTTVLATISATPEAKPIELTPEEKELLKLKAKEEYERQLATSCQKILNKMFPPNSVVVQVNVEFGSASKKSKHYTRLKIRNESGEVTAQVKKITVIVLVDKKIVLTSDIKKNIYQTLSLAVPYNRRRGDRIAIRRVPFRPTVFPAKDFDAAFSSEAAATTEKKPPQNYFIWIVSGIAVLFALFILFIVMRVPKSKTLPYVEDQSVSAAPPTAEEAGDAVVQVKEMAESDPEKVANLLKQWLTEEAE
ncbi:MAG: flagellar M-ring protein FliF [Candidatus Saganbacteria bacterium]|nr:flagellar M-ring protein FliF [Candidatus Saganbacteria bacterium]